MQIPVCSIIAGAATMVLVAGPAVAGTPNKDPGPIRDRIGPLSAGVIISNGTIQLGVNSEAHLNVPGGTPSSGTGTEFVGLRYEPTNAEATAPGCLCEGWGVKDAVSGNWAGGNEDDGGSVGSVPLLVESFVSTASTANSVVKVGNLFRVTHNYIPSASDNLYQVDVTIQNISGSPVDARYRRVMDWDIEPTAFTEYVTLVTGGAPAVGHTSNNGFATSEPFDGDTGIGFTGEFTNAGPTDHGALFDFNFGGLAPGAAVSFVTYYGAADTESEALAALALVNATVYSLGKPGTDEGLEEGTPNTFIFAFSGTGGAPLPTPAPVVESVPVPVASSAGVSFAIVLLALAGMTLLYRSRAWD